MTRRPLIIRWLRFLVGLALLLGFFSLFASGITPPGACGAVLRHNRACDIDASPMVPSEVEHMAELEAAVRRRMEAAQQERESIR